MAGDDADKACQIIRFLSHRLANMPPGGYPPSGKPRPAMYVRSRMSLGGLLYDAVYDTIIAGPWKKEMKPSVPQMLPQAAEQAANVCVLSDMITQENQQSAQQPPPESAIPSVTDMDVFGWLK
jgi:hypothetical protein